MKRSRLRSAALVGALSAAFCTPTYAQDLGMITGEGDYALIFSRLSLAGTNDNGRIYFLGYTVSLTAEGVSNFDEMRCLLISASATDAQVEGETSCLSADDDPTIDPLLTTANAFAGQFPGNASPQTTQISQSETNPDCELLLRWTSQEMIVESNPGQYIEDGAIVVANGQGDPLLLTMAEEFDDGRYKLLYEVSSCSGLEQP